MNDPRHSLSPARAHLISQWPQAMKPWSLPKAAAQIHAVLLTSEEGLTAEEIIRLTALSGGSVSTNLRMLTNAGLLDKHRIMGSRKASYKATLDPARIFIALAEVRRQTACRPLLQMGETLASIAGKEDLGWLRLLSQLQALSQLMDDWLHVCSTRDPEWTVRWIQKGVEKQPLHTKSQ